MAKYILTLTVDAAQPASVEKKLREAFGKDVPVHTVEKVKTAESRADRLAEAMSSVDDAKSVVKELKDEMQNWLDNLPENLQSGQKADEIQEAIDALEQVFDNLESVDAESVSFPGGDENMINPVLNTETYEHWMRLELDFAKKQYAAEKAQDLKAADHFYGLRWKCMDLAVDSIRKGLVEA